MNDSDKQVTSFRALHEQGYLGIMFCLGIPFQCKEWSAQILGRIWANVQVLPHSSHVVVLDIFTCLQWNVLFVSHNPTLFLEAHLNVLSNVCWPQKSSDGFWTSLKFVHCKPKTGSGARRGCGSGINAFLRLSCTWPTWELITEWWISLAPSTESTDIFLWVQVTGTGSTVDQGRFSQLTGA